MSDWTFLTNHGHVLVLLSREPSSRLRDLADAVGITERAAQKIVNDLVDGGYVSRERVGRRNRYALDRKAPMRHPVEDEHSVGELLAALEAEEGD